jgi:hypothetical protein
MLLSVEPHEGLWLLSEDGVQTVWGGYRQVENWLDLAENGARRGSQTESDVV